MTTEATPAVLGLSEGLGLAPERAGQPRMMTIIDGAQDDETGHWYSPAAVREMLAAERERCKRAVYDATDWAHETGDFAIKEAIAEWIDKGPNVGAERRP